MILSSRREHDHDFHIAIILTRADCDIKMSGHVTWAGGSSAEVSYPHIAPGIIIFGDASIISFLQVSIELEQEVEGRKIALSR